jgi:hypothetical protein
METNEKVTAIRNGQLKTFTRSAWNRLPKDKYGWQEISALPEKPSIPEEIISKMTESMQPQPMAPEEVIESFDPTGNINAGVVQSPSPVEEPATTKTTEPTEQPMQEKLPPPPPASVAPTSAPSKIVAKKNPATAENAGKKRGRPRR